MRFYFADSLQLYFEPIIALDPEYYLTSGNFALNIPYELQNLDQNLPLRAYLAAGNSWMNFQIGRDRLSFGSGQMGNLALSDSPHFYDFARISFFSSIFKYSVIVSQMPLHLGNEKSNIYSGDLIEGSLIETLQRNLYLHRLDFSVKNKLTISITEAVMVGNSPIEIRYLNPIMVFHSLYSFWNYPRWNKNEERSPGWGDMNGSLFSLELNWNVVTSFALYGQFVMNQIATSYKIEHWEPQVNGLGYLAGSRLSRNFGEWGSVFNLEFIYTYPYLYMNPSPFASYIHMRYLGIRPDRFHYSYIGFPRDTIAVNLSSQFFKDDKLKLNGSFKWLLQGEHDIYWDWESTLEAYNEKTPTGVAQSLFILSFGANYKLLSWLELKTDITGLYSINNNFISNNNQTGAQASFSVIINY